MKSRKLSQMQALGLESQQVKEEKKPVKISLLANAYYYFIETVFINEEKDGFRLFVFHCGSVLKNRVYKKKQYARAAFLRSFKDKAWNMFITPQWTPYYPPFQDWEPLKILKKQRQRDH